MDNKLIGIENNILFYCDEEGNTKVEVLLENEDEEFEERSTCSKMEHVGNEGKQTYNTKYYKYVRRWAINFKKMKFIKLL